MWIVGAVFVLVGLPFLWLARRTFARDAAAAAWPRAPGVILHARVSSSTSTVREKSGASYTRTVYTPIVQYTYVVGSETIEGTSVARSVDGVWMDQSAAQRVVDAYPPDKRVQVLYDPADPKKAHLEVNRSIGAIILLVFGGILAGIGVLLFALQLLV